MIESTDELREILAGTFLARSRIAVATVEDTQENVFAIEVPADPVRAWAHMRGLLGNTGRWPVLTLLHTARADSWEKQIRDADLFSRYYFRDERKEDRRGDSPDAVLHAAEGLDVSRVFRGFREDSSITLEEYLEVTLEGTQGLFGMAPPVSNPAAFLREHALRTQESIERWFFEWEIANCPNPLALPEDGLHHLSWYEDGHESLALLLMPTPNGWEVPAYIHWFAACRRNSQFVVALLRDWHSTYGAELVAHFGTMLQFQVARRPQTAAEAFQLAWHQHLIAPCTTILPGVSPRDHARALMHTDRWFLHERP